MLITVWVSTSLCLPIFLSNHHLQLIHHFKERAETGMKPLGAPFFFAVCKLLIAIMCLVTWIVHNQKSEPRKIRLINTLLEAKYIQYLGTCALGVCSFFAQVFQQQFILFSYSA